MIILGLEIIVWILVTLHFSLHNRLCQKVNLVCVRTHFKLVHRVLSPFPSLLESVEGWSVLH